MSRSYAVKRNSVRNHPDDGQRPHGPSHYSTRRDYGAKDPHRHQMHPPANHRSKSLETYSASSQSGNKRSGSDEEGSEAYYSETGSRPGSPGAAGEQIAEEPPPAHQGHYHGGSMHTYRNRVRGQVMQPDADFSPLIIYVYRNGDEYDRGTEITVTRRMFKHWLALLDFMTRRCKTEGPINFIYTMKGRPIFHFDELKDGGEYVAATHNFKKREYGSKAAVKAWRFVPPKIQSKDPMTLDSPESIEIYMKKMGYKSKTGRPYPEDFDPTVFTDPHNHIGDLRPPKPMSTKIRQGAKKTLFSDPDEMKYQDDTSQLDHREFAPRHQSQNARRRSGDNSPHRRQDQRNDSPRRRQDHRSPPRRQDQRRRSPTPPPRHVGSGSESHHHAQRRSSVPRASRQSGDEYDERPLYFEGQPYDPKGHHHHHHHHGHR